MGEVHGIDFRLYTNPLPKQSFRYRSGGGYTPKSVKSYQEEVALRASEAMRGRDPITAPVYLFVEFYRKDLVRVDNDNLMKAIKDAMNGIVYEDDSQVVIEHSSRKVCRNKPGMVIYVTSLPEYKMEVEHW